jgi:hypothetical protein
MMNMQIEICCEGMKNALWKRAIIMAYPVIPHYGSMPNRCPFDAVNKKFIDECPHCGKKIHMVDWLKDLIKIKGAS